MRDDKIPKKWIVRKLGDFIEFKNGINADSTAYGKGCKFINVMDIFFKNTLYSDNIIGKVLVNDKQQQEYSVLYGDILFNRTSEIPKEIAYSSVYMDSSPMVFGGFVIRGRQIEHLLLPEFTKYCFQEKSLRNELIRRCQGVVRANIGQKDLRKVSIFIPPFKEQKAIAETLQTWDTAIEKTEALIAAKEKAFHATIKNVFFQYSTVKKPLSTCLKEVSKRNKGEAIERVLSVTNHSGFVLPENQFERRVASADVSNYKIVSQGEYAYNPSRINVGSIARLDDWENGILSPMYAVFKIKQNILNSDYFLHWLSSNEAKQRIKNSAQGSVRETVSFTDLCSIPIPLPALATQKEIAYAFNIIKSEITLLKKLVGKYRTQKQGLMQKLLTGEWRLDV